MSSEVSEDMAPLAPEPPIRLASEFAGEAVEAPLAQRLTAYLSRAAATTFCRKYMSRAPPAPL